MLPIAGFFFSKESLFTLEFIGALLCWVVSTPVACTHLYRALPAKLKAIFPMEFP